MQNLLMQYFFILDRYFCKLEDKQQTRIAHLDEMRNADRETIKTELTNVAVALGEVGVHIQSLKEAVTEIKVEQKNH